MQVFDTMVNNAAIGLMADDPIQVSQGLLAALQHGLQATRHGFHRKTKDRFAIHRDRGRIAGCGAADTDGFAPPRAQRDGKRHIFGQFQNSRTSAIPKQYAGCAVGRVHHAGQRFAADDQRIASAQGVQQPVGRSNSINKTGTSRIYIKSGPVLRQPQGRQHWG